MNRFKLTIAVTALVLSCAIVAPASAMTHKMMHHGMMMKMRPHHMMHHRMMMRHKMMHHRPMMHHKMM